MNGAPLSAAGTVRLRMRYLILIAFVAALGGLLFGYDWVVISGAKPFFVPYFRLTSGNAIGWAMSCALLGAMVGAIFTGWASDKFGRKKMLILAALLFTLSSVMTGWASSFVWFSVWRLAGGVAIGIASNISPLYIAEIAPARLRGRLVAVNQLTIVIGILLADMVNWHIARPLPAHATAAVIAASWDGRLAWRWMFTAVAIPSMVFFVGSLLVPESPRWLAKAGYFERAAAVLTRIGGSQHAAKELADIQQSLQGASRDKVNLATLWSKALRRPLLIGIFLAVLQQWCGINIIFSYAQDIFQAAGYHITGVLFEIMVTGLVNLVFTFVAIGLVDKLGRRFLMLLGAGGLVVTHLLLGWAFLEHLKGSPVVVLVMAAIGCYAMTLAPVTWVLISEIFPNRIRGTAVSLAVSALWIADFILTQTFPLLKSAVGNVGAFWLYAAICAAGLLFILKFVPETRNRSLEQVERDFANRGS